MLLAIILAFLTIAYPVPSQADFQAMRPPDDCAKFFSYCKNWPLAAWLPSLPNTPAKPKKVGFVDSFIFNGMKPHSRGFAEMQGAPRGGTPFVYGKAGPPRGEVFYDARHHIAFYGEGCCAWHATVLAAGVGSPPLPVADADLEAVQTVHGLHLGMSVYAAMRVYPHATLVPVPVIAGMSAVAYRHQIAKTCEQDETLGFVADALVFIQIYNAC